MLHFEWDEAKNLANQKKHGVSFELVANLLVEEDFVAVRSDRGVETRFKSVVCIEDDAITVVFTYRNDRIRLISARRASREERKNRALFGK